MESDKPGIDREFHESVSVRNYLMKVFDKDTYISKSRGLRGGSETVSSAVANTGVGQFGGV
jgi:hypothetical protein